jgi:molybdenum cofactor cytidylyltransferase
MPVSERGSAIAAIILAAGLSRRMGTPKQLLRVGKATLLEIALRNVRDSRIEEIVLVLGHQAEMIRSQLTLEGVKVVVNPNYAEGMGTSIRAGLAALSPDVQATFMVLADQPFVRPATFGRLIEEHSRLRPQIVLPMYRGFRGNPVLLDRSVFPELAGLQGDVGCRAIFGNHTENILRVEVNDPGVLLDVDNKEDFRELRQGVSPERPELEITQGSGAVQLTVHAEPASHAQENQQELIVVGRDRFAHTLAGIARLLNFTVTVVDPLLTPDEFPEANRILHVLDFRKLPAAGKRHVVVASRGQFDEEATEQALIANAAYVALVANRRRGEEIKRALVGRGLTQEKLARLHAPAGLEIGAEGAEEIALSVMAELVAEMRKSRG